MGYFGEGGGCFGVGHSKNVLCMHHHNVAHSSRCGKNMSRLVVPHGASVGPPEFLRKRGERADPSGAVFALMTMGRPPWEALVDQSVTCAADVFLGDLGVHNTSHECQSHVDIGRLYNWYPGATAAVWRGSADRHCYVCKLPGGPTTWNLTLSKGTWVFALEQGVRESAGSATEIGDVAEDDDDGDGEDERESSEKLMAHFRHHVEKTRALEWPDEGIRSASTGLALDTSNPRYVLKSWNFGANWTWVLLPDFLQALRTLRADPTNDTTLYGVASNCVGRSYDEAETWEYCWKAPGLVGSFSDLVIKDSRVMIMLRDGDVPLRTRDGGASWDRLASVATLARYPHLGAAFSWSGKTLALSAVVGQIVVWVSTDDGDSWVDESGDYTAMIGGIAQWYGNTLYVSSLGQGISAKVFAEGS